MSSEGSWLQFGNSSNKFKSSYVRGFLDVCGNIQVRQGNLTMSNGDISCNGDIYVNRIKDPDGNLIVSSGGSGTVIDDSTNLTINSLTNVFSTSRLTGNVGIGQSSTSNALDISGNTNVIGNISIAGTTEISGANASVGKSIDVDYNLDVSGTIRTSNNVYIKGSTIIASDASTITDTSGAALYLKDTRDDVSHNIILDTHNTLFKSTVNGDYNRTAYLEIDTFNRRILPFVKDVSGNNIDISGSVVDGWKLGGPGPNRFDEIYARDVKISTNTLLIEDDDSNKIGMSFDAATGAVNYNVTTKEGEEFTIKGVQTQKISSGGGTIDPSLLEFTGLSFGDTFDTQAKFDLTTTYTYDLKNFTYAANTSTTFGTPTSTPQNLNEFLSPDNKDTLLASMTTGDSVVIRVGTDTNREADNFLAPDEDSNSQTDQSGVILIAKKKTSTELEWTQWGTEGDLYHDVSGNYLNYIELKNVNMASGTYFVAKTFGDIIYNISDTDFLTTGDVTGVVSGDLFLYIARGPGKNWTKIPVSLPQSGSIQTQMLANKAVTTTKMGLTSVTSDILAVGSVTADKIQDGAITADKIAFGAISANSFAENSIGADKIKNGTITSLQLDADTLSGKQDVLTGGTNITITAGGVISAADFDIVSLAGTNSILSSMMGLSSIKTDSIEAGAVIGAKISSIHDPAGAAIDYTKIANDAVVNRTIAAKAVTTDKIGDSAVTNDKISTVNGSKIVNGSVVSGKIAVGAINTTDKLANGIVTKAKLDKDAVWDSLAEGTDITLAQDDVTGVVTITSTGGGGGGGGGTTLNSTTDVDVRDINVYGDLSGNDASFNVLEANNIAVQSNVTAHTVTAQNYAVGGTNFISASRQGNFRDLEVKDSNNSATILLTGDGGDMSLVGTLTVDTISEKTDASGVTIGGVLLKNSDVTAHTVSATNYAVGGTNFISASRQGNFRDLEVKDNNNNATILLTGDDGDITLSGSIKQWIP